MARQSGKRPCQWTCEGTWPDKSKQSAANWYTIPRRDRLFTTRANADQRIAELKAKGFDSFIDIVVLNGVTYYRVITRSFAEKSNADKQVADLKAKGFDAFIIVVN